MCASGIATGLCVGRANEEEAEGAARTCEDLHGTFLTHALVGARGAC